MLIETTVTRAIIDTVLIEVSDTDWAAFTEGEDEGSEIYLEMITAAREAADAPEGPRRSRRTLTVEFGDLTPVTEAGSATQGPVGAQGLLEAAAEADSEEEAEALLLRAQEAEED